MANIKNILVLVETTGEGKPKATVAGLLGAAAAIGDPVAVAVTAPATVTPSLRNSAHSARARCT